MCGIEYLKVNWLILSVTKTQHEVVVFYKTILSSYVMHNVCVAHSGSTHRLLPSLKKSESRKRKKSVITPSESLSQFLLKSCESC